MNRKIPHRFFAISFFFLIVSQISAQISISERYYILQMHTLSGKVIGNTQYNEAVLNIPSVSNAQLFQFIPVSGKTNTYNIQNIEGYYLINSIDLLQLTEYSETSEGLYGEWKVEGTGLNSLRFKSGSSGYLATESFNSGSLLLCNKTASDANGLFKLVPESEMIVNGLIDPGFENAVIEGTPLGIWVNNNNRIFGNNDAATLNYRSRVVNNGYQSAGNNAFILRFYGDENSYTRISHQLNNLTPGATYRFTYKYKQSNVNTATATSSSFISLTANDEINSRFGNVFTTIPPSTTAATQSPQEASITFVAPAVSCWVVFVKNPATTTNFLQYIDDMKLTKTAEATSQIYTTSTNFSFTDAVRTVTMYVSGFQLCDSIRISAPDGISVSPSVLAPNALEQIVKLEFKGFYSISDNITLSSGGIIKKIPVTASFTTNFLNIQNTEKYYIQQRAGGKVIGAKTNAQNGVLRHADLNDPTQIFTFIPITGILNTYALLNDAGKYLSVSENRLNFTNDITNNSMWVLQGISDTLVYITQASHSGKVIGSDSIIHDRTLYADKTSTSLNAGFCLQKVAKVAGQYFFDGGFENSPTDAGPLGVWIPANEPIQLGQYGYSRVQTSAWASEGKRCMYLRFLGDATSYNLISHKIQNLNRGATYRLDLKYKCQSTSTSSLVNIYATTSPNAARSAAIGGVYTTTQVAASNLATQTPQSTSLSFVAPASEVYIVYSKNTTATNYNFFIDDLVLTEIIPSAVQFPEKENDFKIYQSGENIIIENKKFRKDFKVELFDLLGKTIYTRNLKSETEIIKIESENISNKGLYFICLTSDNCILTKKILLQ
jgi:hypothetical protein